MAKISNPPNFDRLADEIVGLLHSQAGVPHEPENHRLAVVEYFRRVWNARGAADVAQLAAVLSPFNAPEKGMASVLNNVERQLRDSLRSLDR